MSKSWMTATLAAAVTMPSSVISGQSSPQCASRKASGRAWREATRASIPGESSDVTSAFGQPTRRLAVKAAHSRSVSQE